MASVVASLGVLAAGWAAGVHPAGTTTAVPAGGQATSGTSRTTTQPGASKTTSSTGAQSGTGQSSSGASGTGQSGGTVPGAATGGFQGGPGGRGGGQSVSVGLRVPAGASGTFTGTTSQNRWGSVQVTVTLAAGRITNLTESIDDRGDGHSARINSSAVPVLKQSILAASGGGTVSTVSGATYTTSSYLTSLQSALDQAG